MGSCQARGPGSAGQGEDVVFASAATPGGSSGFSSSGADSRAGGRPVERGLFSTVHGRGANKPVAYQPILRDDSAPPLWHGKPQALLEQIKRGVKALGDQKPVPPDLHQLSMSYLQELGSEQPAPDCHGLLCLA